MADLSAACCNQKLIKLRYFMQIFEKPINDWCSSFLLNDWSCMLRLEKMTSAAFPLVQFPLLKSSGKGAGSDLSERRKSADRQTRAHQLFGLLICAPKLDKLMPQDLSGCDSKVKPTRPICLDPTGRGLPALVWFDSPNRYIRCPHADQAANWKSMNWLGMQRLGLAVQPALSIDIAARNQTDGCIACHVPSIFGSISLLKVNEHNLARDVWPLIAVFLVIRPHNHVLWWPFYITFLN